MKKFKPRNHSRNNNTQKSTAQQGDAKKIPYNFSPIDISKSVTDSLVWRDGSYTDENYTGELLLSFKALTPLLVGNLQRPMEDNNKKENKLVPQMLENGQILIPGSSLNGMLRSTLANLLQAPMSQDKVTEHHYTYRPNLGSSGKEREMRAAVVLNPQNQQGEVEILLLSEKESKNVVFINDDNFEKYVKDKKSTRIQSEPIKGLMEESNNYRKKIVSQDDFRHCQFIKNPNAKKKCIEQREKVKNNNFSFNHHKLIYKGGIDGDGILAKGFKRSAGVYNQVLYCHNEYQKIKSNPENKAVISKEVFNHYLTTQKVLANDKYGHLTSSNPITKNINLKDAKKAIKASTDLEENQLIYVEINPKTNQITSFGHHYQYRWAYTSSIHKKSDEIRQELDLLTDEKTTNDEPSLLAATRLLFGYTQQDESLGKKDYKRLAGRVSFNFALEDAAPEQLAQRLQEKQEPLKLQTLGQPRPSAVEFYLQQNKLPQQLLTYGDEITDTGSNLAGRKYYPHQPDARSNNNLYKAPQGSDQGTHIQWHSPVNTQFKVSLRFANLRPWELGAVLLALNPRLAQELYKLDNHKHGYAHKLGYAKPLGFGSIRFALDKARWYQQDNWQTMQQVASSEDDDLKKLQKSCLNALKIKLDKHGIGKADIEAWLKQLAWNDEGSAAYPTAPQGKNKEETIFAYHSAIRRNHANNRRGAYVKDDFKQLEHQLKTNKANS